MQCRIMPVADLDAPRGAPCDSRPVQPRRGSSSSPSPLSPSQISETRWGRCGSSVWRSYIGGGGTDGDVGQAVRGHVPRTRSRFGSRSKPVLGEPGECALLPPTSTCPRPIDAHLSGPTTHVSTVTSGRRGRARARLNRNGLLPSRAGWYTCCCRSRCAALGGEGYDCRAMDQYRATDIERFTSHTDVPPPIEGQPRAR